MKHLKFEQNLGGGMWITFCKSYRDFHGKTMQIMLKSYTKCNDLLQNGCFCA